MATQTRRAGELHVEPGARGRWIVCYEHRQRPLSEHSTANEAEADAERRAHAEGITRVLLHDCYARVHEVSFRARGRSGG
jgi:hypothetical protein